MAKKIETIFDIAATFDEDGVQASSGIGHDGKEYPDPVPMAPPVGYTPPMDLMTMIRTMIQSEKVRAAAEELGYESFEESDDFDIEDDPIDPLTEYEKIFYPRVDNPPPAENGGKRAPEEAAVAPSPPSAPVPPTPEGKAEAGVSSPPPSKSA